MSRTLLQNIREDTGDESNICNKVFRHGDWLLCVTRNAGDYPYECEGTRRDGERKTTERFSNALSCLAWTVTRIDTGDWK
jgi:hypothetical protein